MAYITPSQLSTGEARMHENWNQDVVNNTIFLYSPPFIQTSNSSTVSVGYNTIATIDYGTADHDTDGMESSRGDQLTVQTAGVYLVSASCQFERLAGGTVPAGYIRMWLQHASGLIFASTTHQHSATVTNVALGVTGFIKCSAGDAIKLQAFNTCNSPNGVQVAANTLNFSAIWTSAGETTP